MNIAWADKHAPKQLGEIAGHRDKIVIFHKWLSEFNESSSKKLLLLSGPTGCGKTLISTLVPNRLSYKRIVVEGCELSRNNTMRAAETLTMSTVKAGRKWCMIIENIEDSDTSTIRSMIDCSKVPIIGITSAHYHVKLKTLRTCLDCLRIELMRPREDDIKRFLCRVCKRAYVALQEHQVISIVKSSDGDLRRCLNQLQFYGTANRVSDPRTVTQMTSFEAAKLTFKARKANSMSEILSVANAGDLVDLFVQENYLCNLDKIDDAYKCADWLSNGDRVERFLPPEFSECLSIVAPAIICQNERPIVKNFPSLLGKSSTSRKNVGTLRHVQKEVTVACKVDYGQSLVCEVLPQIRKMVVADMKKALYEKNSKVKKAIYFDIINRMKSLRLTRTDMIDIYNLQVSENSFSELSASLTSGLTKAWC